MHYLTVTIIFILNSLSTGANDISLVFDIHENLVLSFIETLNEHEVEAFASLFSEDGQYEEVPTGRIFRGRSAINRYIGSTLSGIPDSKFEIGSMMANEEYGMVEWVWTGTNSVGWPQMGIQATNAFLEIKGVSIMEFQDGKILNNRDYWDYDSFLKGIGVKE